MPEIIPEYDDLFIYAPSYILWERGELDIDGLNEGKSFSAATLADLSIISTQWLPHGNPNAFAKERKSGQTVGFRKLKETQSKVLPVIRRLITKFQNGSVDADELHERVVKVMKSAWKDVYLAGVRSAGAPGEGSGPGKVMVKLGPNEDKWLKGAMTHEMRYLNKFLKAVVEGTGKMPYERRAKMYVDAMQSFYESARVIGMPTNVLIRWIGPKDGDTCESCKYIIEHNPYTKYTLPTTPRGGQTKCLTNCRHKLLVRIASPEQVVEATQSSPTRESMLAALSKIKRE
jgi:hypothetical protein